ncbi:UNVERIFIED_CONTAM: hypothetical protein K2H54_049924 [Gekko kuhli]
MTEPTSGQRTRPPKHPCRTTPRVHLSQSLLSKTGPFGVSRVILTWRPPSTPASCFPASMVTLGNIFLWPSQKSSLGGGGFLSEEVICFRALSSSGQISFSPHERSTSSHRVKNRTVGAPCGGCRHGVPVGGSGGLRLLRKGGDWGRTSLWGPEEGPPGSLSCHPGLFPLSLQHRGDFTLRGPLWKLQGFCGCWDRVSEWLTISFPSPSPAADTLCGQWGWESSEGTVTDPGSPSGCMWRSGESNPVLPD